MAMERRVGVEFGASGIGQVVSVNQIWKREMAGSTKAADSMTQSIRQLSKATTEFAKGTVIAGVSSKDLRKDISSVRQEIANTQAVLNTYRYATDKLSEGEKQYVNQLRQRIAELRQLEQALGRQVTATAEVEREQRRQAQAAEQAAKQQERAARDAARAQEVQTRALTMNLKKLLLWTVGARTMFRVVNSLRMAVRDFVDDVAEGTREQERMNAASMSLRASLAAAFGPEVLRGYENLAILAERAAKWVLELAVQVEISRRVHEAAATSADKHARMLLAQGASAEAVVRTHESLSETLLDEESAWEAVTGRYDDFMKKMDEGTGKYEAALSSIISATRQWNESLRAHEERIADIRERYREAAQAARDEWFAELTRINRELADKIADINEEADQDRLDAFDRFNRDMAKAQQRANKELESDAERHALEMEFARRRHQLSMIQNERVYQYERNLLVAEGDVLAIENLDARHQLEQQAQDENFRLQMEQAEAMFRLQARVQAEAAREQAAILRQSLDERLREIEEERDKEVAEAEEAAAEERMIASQEYKATAADLKEQQEEQLADEEKNYQRRIENAGEFWADFAREYGLGVDEVLRITKALFGDQGELEQAIRDTYSQTATVSTLFAQAWTNAMNQVKSAVTTTELAFRSLQTTMSATMATSYSPYGYPSRGRPRGRQYGGEDIVSTPTHFVAGEAYMPERVTVEPLSPLMGNVTLSWSGGAIPVHGTGTMAGADTTEVMNELAQGLIIAVNDRLLGLRGQRGY